MNSVKSIVRKLRDMGNRRIKPLVNVIDKHHESLMADMGQVKNIQELEQFIKNNWEFFWLNSVRCNRVSSKLSPFQKLISLSFNRVSFIECINNTHGCPRAGVENFERKNDLPKGYPGWNGTVTFDTVLTNDENDEQSYIIDYCGTKYFDSTLLHLGSGGSRDLHDAINGYVKRRVYTFTLWAADFPVLHEEYRRHQWLDRATYGKQLMWNELGGKGYVDPVTELPDTWVCPNPLVAISPCAVNDYGYL